MVSEADLNILVSNVVSENRNKHCRLCLKEVKESFIRFEDQVSYDQETFIPLSEILVELFGKEICEEIPAVDVVCADCAQKTMECLKFVQGTKKSTEVLNKIFNKLSEALMIDYEIPENFERLYVVIGDNESRVVLLDKEDNEELALVKPDISSEANSIVSEPILQKISCNKCFQLCESQADLQIHCDTSHSFLCIECQGAFPSEESLKIHEDKVHTKYVCQLCGRSCNGSEKLEAHKSKHNAKNECPKCGKSYLTKDCYKKHVDLCLSEKIEMHPFRANMEKKFCCDKCGKGYSCIAGLNVHRKFVHGNNKGHACHVCGKTFSAQSYLKLHMVKHTGEKNFNCGICSRSFVSKEALLYHTRRHTGEKPYFCNLCEERFVNASARAEHIKYKHQSPKFTCDICDKKIFTPSFLKQHRAKHFDPMSKLYIGRNQGPANEPGEHNIRTKVIPIETDIGL